MWMIIFDQYLGYIPYLCCAPSWILSCVSCLNKFFKEKKKPVRRYCILYVLYWTIRKDCAFFVVWNKRIHAFCTVLQIIKQMWPFIGEYAKDLMFNTIEPLIQQSLDAYKIKSFKFEKIDMGDLVLGIVNILNIDFLFLFHWVLYLYCRFWKWAVDCV